MVLEELARELPEHERAAGVRYEDDPRSLARLATRTEIRQPGALERSFGGMGSRGIGYGGLMGGSFLSAFAGILVGSAIAEQFFGDASFEQGSAEGDDAAEADADDAGEVDDVGGDLGGATSAGATLAAATSAGASNPRGCPWSIESSAYPGRPRQARRRARRPGAARAPRRWLDARRRDERVPRLARGPGPPTRAPRQRREGGATRWIYLLAPLIGAALGAVYGSLRARRDPAEADLA